MTRGLSGNNQSATPRGTIAGLSLIVGYAVGLSRTALLRAVGGLLPEMAGQT